MRFCVSVAALVLLVVCCEAAPFLKVDDPILDQKYQCPPTKAVIPYEFPVFKQCDSKWGSDEMVTTTVCKVGCLMSSISSGLNGRGILIEGKEANPGVLNAWLRTHKGYDATNDLDEDVIPLIDPSRVSWNCSYCGFYLNATVLQPDTIKQWLEEDRIVIANVDKGGHFVLVTGFDASDDKTLYVNDSGFDRNCYPYSEVVGWRVFQMTPKSVIQ